MWFNPVDPSNEPHIKFNLLNYLYNVLFNFPLAWTDRQTDRRRMLCHNKYVYESYMNLFLYLYTYKYTYIFISVCVCVWVVVAAKIILQIASCVVKCIKAEIIHCTIEWASWLPHATVCLPRCKYLDVCGNQTRIYIRYKYICECICICFAWMTAKLPLMCHN